MEPRNRVHQVSAGCDNCYAERIALRLQKAGTMRCRNGFAVTLHPDVLGLPLQWREPGRIFVNSMSDRFQGVVPRGFIDQVFDVMEEASWHVFQILTKRPARMAAYFTGSVVTRNGPIRVRDHAGRRVAPNVWLGKSVEDARVLGRIEHLRRIPAPVRFLSCEPLIGSLGDIDLAGIDWVIAGGESGPGHRPMRREWVQELRRQCRAHHVPFFFKQWGGPRPTSGGRELDGRTYDAMPKPREVRLARA